MEEATDTYREAVASEVRALMGRHRTSQTKLAKVLGVSQSALSRRLTGDLAFDTDDIFALARYFDVRLSALLPEPAEVAKVEDRATGLLLRLPARRPLESAVPALADRRRVA